MKTEQQQWRERMEGWSELLKLAGASWNYDEVRAELATKPQKDSRA